VQNLVLLSQAFLHKGMLLHLEYELKDDYLIEQQPTVDPRSKPVHNQRGIRPLQTVKAWDMPDDSWSRGEDTLN